MSNANQLREQMWYIRLWRNPPPDIFIIYDESSAPSADDYLIDTQYPLDLSRRSSKNEDGNLPF
jgi:hypothetical protein